VASCGRESDILHLTEGTEEDNDKNIRIATCRAEIQAVHLPNTRHNGLFQLARCKETCYSFCVHGKLKL
jgi:hypothetical protein